MSDIEKGNDAYKKVSEIVGTEIGNAFHRIMRQLGETAKSEEEKTVELANSSFTTSELKDFFEVLGYCDMNLVFFPTFASGRNAKHIVSDVALHNAKGASLSIGVKIDF